MSSFQKKKKLWGLQKQGSVTHIWAEKRKYLVKTEYDEVQRQNVADKNFRATENTQIMSLLSIFLGVDLGILLFLRDNLLVKPFPSEEAFYNQVNNNLSHQVPCVC